MKFLIAFFLVVALHPIAHAMGNHPESNLCPDEKPYFVFCSHSLHNLEGWYGSCHANKEEAEQAAIKHADTEHGGNTRWTGVKQNRSSSY